MSARPDRPPAHAVTPGHTTPASGAAPDGGCVVDVSEALEPFLARWAALPGASASPFQSVAWLRAWYATLGARPGVRPVLVGVRRSGPAGAAGRDVMLCALASRRRRGVSVVEFADATVVDYNLPLVSADWAADSAADRAADLAADRAADQATDLAADLAEGRAEGGAADRASGTGAAVEAVAAQAIWRAVRAALSNHDVLRIEKMAAATLPDATATANPLVLALRTQPCEMFGNQFHAPGDWDTWRHSLDKRVRKELERCWRVFTRSAEARFERITEPVRARAVLEALERLQAERVQGLGYRYVLDQPAWRDLYREALAGGLADGSVVLTALHDGEQLVAALFGVANARRFIALRLVTGGDAWKACSPGRLLLERSARDLHASGLHWFDFGIGEYAHKEVFKVSTIALVDACEALSWRGRPLAWAWALRRALKRNRWLVQAVRKVRGQG